MKFLITIILTGLLFPAALQAQFTDSTTKFLKLASGGSINKTKDGANYLFNNNVQYSIKKKRTQLNSTGTWIYGMSPDRLTNNDFTLSSNVNLYRHFPEFYYWGILNYTTSYSLNIKHQGQAGIGVAYNFLNKPDLWLNVSNGFIGELSRIIQGDTTTINYQTIRNSLRVQFMFKLGDRFTFKTGNLFQPSLEYISDHTISSDSEFTYQLWKGLNLNTRLIYNKNSRTEKENLILTYGVGYQRYF
ncbi:DUF481 domain-containing protein [Niabella ginsengisoli]|uniref:DUF481 domain-containing protein n=1 Tax=Niabella ginsengisoli TaxID=522298 RepID=A0ABS9SM67_9BACT|nr:DUF481 domain-containing protein [Niabella ginsengisoli]MCH5599457.1 DUF481 domain-containing protein [Niabella ginsengisoli]